MYSARFTEALAYATEIHATQYRKGTRVPYVLHLMAVAAIVGEEGGDEDQVIAGLLHDAIEDCIDKVPDIREHIERRFGTSVLEIVEACTDADVIPKPPWRARKEAYIERLWAKGNDHPSLLVALADKVHNSRSLLRDHSVLGDELFDRFRGGQEGTLWYYRELSKAFSDKIPGPLATELERIVDELHRVAGA